MQSSLQHYFTALEIRDGIAVIWLDNQSDRLNIISLDVLDEFDAILNRIEGGPEIRAAVLISRKEDNFIAGADIEKFQKMEAGQAAALSQRGNQILSRVAGSSKPFVAAIHGAALGGGLEVALACQYRIASTSEQTKMGLPEVKLGLLPAAGGTQRLPRLVGLQEGLKLLLSGNNVYPKRARKMGLVDHLIHPHGLFQAALQAASELASGELPANRPSRDLSTRLMEGNPLGRKIVFKKASERVEKKSRGNYPAPSRILKCVQIGYEEGIQAGLEAEARCFEELMQTPEAQELIHLFFNASRARKNPDKELAREVRSLGILGAGLMGSGIAQVTAEKRMRVYLKDVELEHLAGAEKSIFDELERKRQKGAYSEFERDQVMSRIQTTRSYRAFREIPLVIEAVFEDLDLKQSVLTELEPTTSSDLIFASNTSSIPIKEIAAPSKRPAQVIGMHYFSPVPKMPLLEIVRTPDNPDWVIATAREIGLRQGKHVIVVADGPGFYTTRILTPYMNEALLLLEEGGKIEEIDQAMKNLGFPVGPLTLMDEVGLDVSAHVSRVMGPLFARRGITSTNAAERLEKAGLRGKKNRQGFYRYNREKKPNASIYDHFGGRDRKTLKAEQIQDRLLLMMLNEAAYCLQEEIIQSPEDGDLGAVMGLGFPPFMGGPFRLIDRTGCDRVVSRMRELESELGKRFKPAQVLEKMLENEWKFYGS